MSDRGSAHTGCSEVNISRTQVEEASAVLSSGIGLTGGHIDREVYTCTYSPSPGEDVSLVGICRVKIDVRVGDYFIAVMFLRYKKMLE